MSNVAAQKRTEPLVKQTVSTYIKAIIAGQDAQPPESKWQTLTALYAAKSAIGCVTGRDTIASQRVRAEITRVRQS